MIRQSGFLQREGCAQGQFLILQASPSHMDLHIFLSNEILASEDSLTIDFEFSAHGSEVEGPCDAAILVDLRDSTHRYYI